MAPVDAATSLEYARFAVGQPVRRSEDPKLLTGRGTYTDDIDLPGQAHAWMLRSPLNWTSRTISSASAPWSRLPSTHAASRRVTSRWCC